MTRERLSAVAVLPDDVIDPLLWRLAFDVVAAHQPDERGDCRNLQCASQRGMCSAARNARRAMTLARRHSPAVVQTGPAPYRGRAASKAHAPARFRGWFASTGTQSRTGRRNHSVSMTAVAA
ncbi:hypothetical protein ACTMSW_21890 [Micromonospora sp. BQ11]|uniref:hypothetical protein n=1 Tax=Micromonospora sp. BQ11 TaxID=3452212 RepID=UPI003F8CB1BF